MHCTLFSRPSQHFPWLPLRQRGDTEVRVGGSGDEIIAVLRAGGSCPVADTANKPYLMREDTSVKVKCPDPECSEYMSQEAEGSCDACSFLEGRTIIDPTQILFSCPSCEVTLCNDCKENDNIIEMRTFWKPRNGFLID